MEAVVDECGSSITVSYIDYCEPSTSAYSGYYSTFQPPQLPCLPPLAGICNKDEDSLSDVPKDFLDLEDDEPYSSDDETELSRETIGLKHLTFGYQVEDFEHQDANAWVTIQPENNFNRVRPEKYIPKTNCAPIELVPYRDEATGNHIPESVRIMSIVNRFIGEDFYQLLTLETNRYYHQQQQLLRDGKQHNTSYQNRIKWTDVTVNEMKIFIGLLILMPCVKKANLQAYWSADMYHSTPIFSQLMSRDRFFEIWKYWHFNDNLYIGASGLLMRDRGCKVRPVLDYFRNKFDNIYQVKRDIFLREEIFPWAGRRRFTFRHNPRRVGSLGLVLRTIAECGTGYVMNVDFEDIVASLTLDKWQQILSPFYGRNHHLYVDSCYTSVGQARKLLQEKIYLCGPIAKTRGVPTKLLDMEKSELADQGGHVFVRNGPILLHSWCNRRSRPIKRMISSIHEAKLQPPHKVIEQKLGTKDKPACLVAYERHMSHGGGGLLEQFIADYNFLGVQSRFSKRIVLFMLRVAIHNSFILYRQLYPAEAGTRLLVDYVWLAAKEICREGQRKMSPTAQLVPVPSASLADVSYLGPVNQVWIHFPVHIVPPEGGKKFPTLKCVLCTKVKKRRSETRYCCSYCKLPLHIECFPEFHGIDYPSKVTVEQVQAKVKHIKEKAKANKDKQAKRKTERMVKPKTTDVAVNDTETQDKEITTITLAEENEIVTTDKINNQVNDGEGQDTTTTTVEDKEDITMVETDTNDNIQTKDVDSQHVNLTTTITPVVEKEEEEEEVDDDATEINEDYNEDDATEIDADYYDDDATEIDDYDDGGDIEQHTGDTTEEMDSDVTEVDDNWQQEFNIIFPVKNTQSGT